MRDTQSHSSEAGVVLITTLLLMTLLLAVGISGLGLSRSDLLVSHNLLIGSQALWLARAGAEAGKNWIETSLPGATLPITLEPTALESGSYTVTVAALGNRAYRLTSIGTGPDESRRVVEEIVRLPDFSPAGVVTSDGDGLHPDFDDASGGVGRRIPDFSIDARNHALDGTLSSLCPAVAPFAVTQTGARNDLTSAASTLKREIVTRANSFCLMNGSDAAGTCTPGLFWVRGSGSLPRFQTGTCVTTTASCFLNLDLTSAALRALANPPASHLPPAPENRGPFTSSVTSFVQLLNTTEQTRLHTALSDLSQRIAELPEERISHISASLHSGHYEYGSLTKPAVVRVAEGVEAIDLDGGVVINGIGVLLIPRVVRLGNATLNWKGLIVIEGAGDLRVEEADACGQVLGAVVVHDDATLDRKLDLDLVQRGGCPPFALNYSCEAVTRALTALMRTVSWIEKYGA
jgi:hypothetical protein